MFAKKLSCFIFLFSFFLPAHLVEWPKFPKSELVQRPSSLVSVYTKLGTVIGYRQDVRNQTINVFYGVPFAEPPIGKLRFKRSKLITKFPQNPYPALSFKPHCYVQKKNFHPSDEFSEDCKYFVIHLMVIFVSYLNVIYSTL